MLMFVMEGNLRIAYCIAYVGIRCPYLTLRYCTYCSCHLLQRIFVSVKLCWCVLQTNPAPGSGWGDIKDIPGVNTWHVENFVQVIQDLVGCPADLQGLHISVNVLRVKNITNTI